MTRLKVRFDEFAAFLDLDRSDASWAVVSW